MKCSLGRVFFAFFFVLAMCLLHVPAQGQAVHGSIFGTLTDSTGAAIPNARVTVTSIGRGVTRETTTNETGNYRVTHLIPGEYSVRAEAQGFKVFEAQSIRVFADQSARVDGQLELGTAEETITITAEDVPLLKTDRSDVAVTFTDRALTELPVISRNFTEFQLLTPGTQTLTWQHAASENTQRSTQIFVNGQHFSGTSYQLDGTDNRDPILGIIVVNPILDSVTEAKITTAVPDAEFGQAIAAVITAQTKSGTNNFHGTGFWFRRNDQLAARDPFTEPPDRVDPVTGEVKPKPDALWNQFGGTIGGPILQNKLFFFGGYQGTREKVGRSVVVTVPTDLVRSTCLNAGSANCDLSEYLTAGLVHDPDDPNRPAFAGNIIPNNRISAQARALLNLLPAPNRTGLRENYVAGGTGGFNDDAFTTRIDYVASDNVNVFGRYSFFESDLTGRGVFDTDAIAVGGRGLGLNGFAGLSDTRNQSFSTGFNYTVSPTMLTDFRFGWFKYRVVVAPNGLGTSPADDLGIPGLNLDDFFTSGMPAFFIGDGGQDGGDMELGYALSDRLTRCNCPLRQTEDQFQFVNNWTRSQGNHTFKFGGDIRYARNLRVPSDRHRAGELSFNRGRTANLAGVGGLPLATFLLGDVTRFTRYPPDSPTDAGERQKRWFFYGQDQWRVSPRFTLNFGLRWELYFPESVTGDAKGGFLDLNTGNVLVAGVGGIPRDFGVEMSYTNFAPRLGMSYQVTDKTVLRMGYGRSFDIGVFGSIFGHAVTQNLPVLPIQEQEAPSLGSVFDLATGPSLPPAIPIPDNGMIPLPDGIFQRARPNRMRLPTVDAWNLTVQHELSRTLSVELGYVGNKGTHVFAGDGPAYNINQATLQGFAPGRDTNAARVFFPAFGWTQGIDFFGNNASNNYHGLQAKLEKRFSQGYQFLAHYTWSQAFNHDGDYYPIDPRVNYGPNNFNRRHVFVLTNMVELPFGRGKTYLGDASSVVDAIVGGWQISSLWNWSGGLPFSPTLNNCGSFRDTGPCRPNMLVDPGDIEYGDRNGWFPVGLGSVWEYPAPGNFGSAGRNVLRGPGFFQTDLSIIKRFTLTEEVRAEFRTEIQNVFNNVNLGTPGIFWSQFGGGGGNCVDCGGAGEITSLGGPMRQAQFGIRLTF